MDTHTDTTTKQCSWCKHHLALDKYYSDDDPQCRVCHERRAADRAKLDRWRQSPEGQAFRRRVEGQLAMKKKRSLVERTQGLTLEEYNGILNYQRGVCARSDCDRKAADFKRMFRLHENKLYCQRCANRVRAEEILASSQYLGQAVTLAGMTGNEHVERKVRERVELQEKLRLALAVPEVAQRVAEYKRRGLPAREWQLRALLAYDKYEAERAAA
jgi:hypothetical protein